MNISQKVLFLRNGFNKAFDWMNCCLIAIMHTWLKLDEKFNQMVSTLFESASASITIMTSVNLTILVLCDTGSLFKFCM